MVHCRHSEQWKQQVVQKYEHYIILAFRAFCGWSGSDSCMLCSCTAVLQETEQIGVIVFQNRVPDMYLADSVQVFVRNSKSGRSRPPPVLLTERSTLPPTKILSVAGTLS